MRKLPSEPRLARAEDHQTIVNLVKEASSWLHTKGTDQWARPWPSERERDERIAHGLRSEATWMIWEGCTAVATITSYRRGDARLWTPEERAQPAAYVHRLIINREYAGQAVGAAFVDWAADRASAEYGARCVRIDVWATNTALHDYYRAIGFSFVRLATGYTDYPSGALFQRPTTFSADSHAVGA